MKLFLVEVFLPIMQITLNIFNKGLRKVEPVPCNSSGSGVCPHRWLHTTKNIPKLKTTNTTRQIPEERRGSMDRMADVRSVFSHRPFNRNYEEKMVNQDGNINPIHVN
jgi:hypothetical protein